MLTSATERLITGLLSFFSVLLVQIILSQGSTVHNSSTATTNSFDTLSSEKKITQCAASNASQRDIHFGGGQTGKLLREMYSRYLLCLCNKATDTDRISGSPGVEGSSTGMHSLSVMKNNSQAQEAVIRVMKGLVHQVRQSFKCTVTTKYKQ
jgi:hypothetical protein